MLKESIEVIINFHDDNPLSVDLPIAINCKIISTDASLKGQTVSSSYKPATIENNVKIQVPPFIETNDENQRLKIITRIFTSVMSMVSFGTNGQQISEA